MLTVKTKRYKNSLISFNRNKKFRDDLIVFGKRVTNVVFLTTFNNVFWTYRIISQPVSNGLYKVKVSALDDKYNENTPVEGTVLIDFYPLPPVNVTVSVVGNNVTLTWEHSVDGAPDSYVIYGNGGSGNINKNIALYTLSGSLLTYTFPVANGQWIFVVESLKSSVLSDSLNIISAAVPPETVIPPRPGPSGDNPLAATGLVLEHVSVGKVRISFLWLYGNEAATFNIYHDNGTGTIDYSTPQFTFTRLDALIQTYLTTQISFSDTRLTYKFAVRAVTSDGVEETNEDEYEIEVDGESPDQIQDLDLSTIF